ncbi:anaerobic selenocysteine-containing dehydrogenase [Paenibacillus phyllosphaerae]|uniref:Anaerobic selenocysteine-containing dehydrogenase n=1 Tax=Paenibacillus phyllosphaerae TaxID=274593 RepID=A0A7W5ATT6_9BACL|nr:molybdopterin oxidoreductase family protein [Paenibacillus phyllosphaerae]MBB3108645.1 anaerobic selenocysteine-containing dehydrogenase [Paenibacillus phyllosphaerae]
MTRFVDEQTGVFPSVCSLDCPDQCGLLIHKEAGRIVKVEGDPSHPVTQGKICNKVRNMAERLYDPKRLEYPMKRIGRKGEGLFERISWEEAVETITSKWKRLIADEGADSIMPYSFYGNMGMLGTEGLDRRFFHHLGATRLQYTICSAAGSEGYGYTMGGSFGIDPEDTVHSKLIVMWGINAASTNMHQVMIAEKARKNGAQIIVIDVHKNQTGRWADWFIPIQPGTDTALALGLMHILFDEGMVDEAFLRDYTVGAEELREHVKAYPPQLVSSITGVPVEDIYKLARLYGETKQSFIRIGNGPQHHDNGGMCIRTIACLPALTGAWMHQGGGAIKGNGGYLEHNAAKLQRPDLLKVKTRRVNMNLIGQALTELDPPIRSMYVYNSNPAVVAPDANKVREGLQREDLFTVVHELFMTETAKYADIVLPATSSYENTDFYASYWHHYIQIQQPVIQPYGESKSNTDVFRLLAHAMGFTEPALFDSDEELIRQSLDASSNPVLEGITYESLVEHQFVRGQVKPLMSSKLPTPSGKIELYSKTMERRGYPPLPTYTPLVEDGDLPFQYIPAPNHNFLNSTFSHNDKHVKLEKAPKLHMNEADAAGLGIATGDRIRVWNGRGSCELTAAVGTDVQPGVVLSQGLWADASVGGDTLNALTPARVADMGGGATFFSGRVQVEKCG